MSKHGKTRYIFVSGGVISALGKGITAASVAFLLKRRNFSVTPIKCENNLNWDFGTVNPIEHGDPFLCDDGLEGDQDLGNYERFLDQEVGHSNFMTMGQLYLKVIQNERNMHYEGEDVEPIPHVVDEIIRRIKSTANGSDFVVIELGGTVGEYENNNGLYYEAARKMSLSEPVAHIHVTYILQPSHIGEPKTKPAQLGIRDLMSMNIMPDFIVTRSQVPIDQQRKYKFSLKFGIKEEHIISAENLDNIHKVPVHLHGQKLDTRLLDFFDIKKHPPIKLDNWRSYLKKLKKRKTNTAKIAIVGKYFGTGDSQLNDSYHALLHAIESAAVETDTEIEYNLINSEKSENDVESLLAGSNGIIVPIGWGTRGVEGKIRAIKYAREYKVPYLGLCYGMQLAAVEFARNVLGLKDAHTEEVDSKTQHKIIHSIPFHKKYQTIKGKSTSMRLGSFDCILKPGTLAYSIYDQYDHWKNGQRGTISERHRHRFEFNNEYREKLENKGFVISGVSPDDVFVEMIELTTELHPFFVATQAHPEYKSTPLNPHPLFLEFLKATFS
ncbi:MAG: CTP synthase [Candidatus Dojkabacteria bacterium]